MKSDTGSLLTKIASIINLVFAGILIILGILMILLRYSKSLENILIKLNIIVAPVIIGFILILVSLIILILGLLMMMASNKMKSPKTVRSGAIWAIVLGAITIGQITGILSLIGGVIGLIDSNK